MTKEVRIGLLVSITVLVFFVGFYYLRGASVFSSTNTYYAHFDGVQGLQPSSVVTIRGMMVGRVKKIELDGEDGVRVALTVKNQYTLPKGTVAQLYSADLMGAKAIRLELGQSRQPLEDGAILPATREPGKLDALSEELRPILQNVQHITLRLDTLLAGVNSVFDAGTRRQLDHAVASLDATLQNFASVSQNLQSKNAALGRTIDNAEKTSAMLAGNRANIDATLNNLSQFSNRLKAAPIEETVQNLQAVAGNVNGLLQKMDSGNGSLGLLINDPKLYNSLSQTAQEFSQLAEDLRKHPGRYINVNIFGRRAQTVAP
jgi:phospholipid/cholesterol/gamma-HCH transport system substrate-binding protein